MFIVSPRFDVPQEYTDGLIFRHEDVIRLKVPLVAKPPPKVRLPFSSFCTKQICKNL